jgi:hypothetical protein
MWRFSVFLLTVLLSGPAFGARSRAGWIEVQLKGTPREMGRTHGAGLRAEIEDGLRAIQTIIRHDTEKEWDFYRRAAEEILWPKVEAQYREEIDGIVEGLRERGSKLDRWDIVALNGWMELAWYYVPVYNKRQGQPTPPTVTAPEHCSAFIATGSFTKDGGIVAAHNAWVDFAIGQRWNIIFDIRPAQGQRMLMDGYPGLIHSGDDFGMNAAGILITETTISAFQGFDEKGVPAFVRARKALQYGTSIDEVAAIFREGNNGGYANAWLIGDNKTKEIARLELGLKNVTLERTKDGYFAGANFPVSEKLIAEETVGWDAADKSTSPTARRVRWEALLTENKGNVDLRMARRWMGDEVDSFTGKKEANERTLCGRIDLSARGSGGWQPPYGPCGAVQNKAADSTLISRMSLWAAMGPQCGPDFRAREFLKAHPEFGYQEGVLRDLPRRDWVKFAAAK